MRLAVAGGRGLVKRMGSGETGIIVAKNRLIRENEWREMDQEYLQLVRKNGKENCPSIIAFLFLREREKGGEDEVKKLLIDPQHKSLNKANKTIQCF